ncbi:MAG: hypothetical protein AAF626_17635, partial [Pseudomonadota bacterium]
MRLDGIFDELGAALSEAAARFEEGGGTVRRSRTYQTKQGPIHAEAGVNVHLLGLVCAAASYRAATLFETGCGLAESRAEFIENPI